VREKRRPKSKPAAKAAGCIVRRIETLT